MENRVNNYKFSKYVYPSRWVSYWHQISEVLEMNPGSVLLVGKGDGIVGEILKRNVLGAVKTLDISPDLEPDIVGSVESLPVADQSFDVVLCAEVLEHLPFEKFERCLSELKRVAKGGVVLSLPHCGPQLKLNFKIPLLKEVKIAVKIPFPREHKFNGEHYWEIGKRGYSSGKIRAVIKKYFKIKKEFIPFENQYHHFFVLEKHEN